MDHDPSNEIKPPHVLLADDDSEDQELFCLGMKDIYPHVRVKLFISGEALLKYLNDYPFQVLPKCIVFDYKMPGLSGPEVLQAVGFLTKFAGVPKIIWTTLAFEHEIQECLALGAARVYSKPATHDAQKDLLKTLYQEFINIAPPSPGESKDARDAGNARDADSRDADARDADAGAREAGEAGEAIA